MPFCVGRWPSPFCAGCGGGAGRVSAALGGSGGQIHSVGIFPLRLCGAEAAAAEYNIELSIAGPETEEDYETQNRLIAEAVRAGAEAIVFSAIDQEENAAAIDAAAQAGLQIVAIDSSVDSDQVSTYIGTNNYAAGQMAADAVLDRVSGPLYVGVVNYDVSTANGQERSGVRPTPLPPAAGRRSPRWSTP